MAKGLPVTQVVNVTVTISPTAAPTRNFGAGLLIGITDVIDVAQRLRSYASLEGVGGDFGVSDPEYAAAAQFFSQDPQPSLLYIGRWAQTATRGILVGGVLSTAEQLLPSWTSITTGSMKLDIDGSTRTLSNLNFSTALNMPGVAAIIDTALSSWADCIWDSNSNQFIIKSLSTGTSSTVGYASSTGTGVDISAKLKMLSATADRAVSGVAAETLASAISSFADTSGDWYAAIVLPQVTTDVALAASAVVEGLGKKRVIGYTITSTTALSTSSTTDLAYLLSSVKYKRSWTQYSSSDAYAVASFFGRAATVDFTGSKTALTMKFKQEPGVTPETLTVTQASALDAKHCNVFVKYDNSTAIIQQGWMANGYFFDEVHGTDWLENYIQTEVWNLLYTSRTKVPQTDEGMGLIKARIEKCCQQAVENGLVAPGIWNAAGFGTLAQGDNLPAGYYVYAPPVSSQSQADREARKSVPFQVAIKLAGAVHFVTIAVYVNR
ncbi:DUF3383 domain-containing protein [Xanthobacter sp. V0B-10]|uniref:DUF3383 domain-containing protein n=1 Tax=Xanthobacter albus TaxID=3119929 RepID=UPI00372B8563